MVTYCATGVRPTMEECASHSDNLCFHLPYARKNVWVEWIAPCKIPIYLKITPNKQTNDKSSKVLHKLQTSNQGETNVIERTDQEMKLKKTLLL